MLSRSLDVREIGPFGYWFRIATQLSGLYQWARGNVVIYRVAIIKIAFEMNKTLLIVYII